MEKWTYTLGNMADTNGYLFEMVVSKGYDLDDFVRQEMTSDFGISRFKMDGWWAGEAYVFECFEEKFDLKKAVRDYSVYDNFFPGCLYMYWVKTRGLSPDMAYKMAPLNVLCAMYPRLHICGWEYCCDELEDCYKKGRKLKLPW